MTDILLVEDHTELNELMRIFLEKEGYSVKGVCSGEEALEFLKTEKRTEIAERIKVALGFGDLSENSEYDEAKSAQAANENKIADFENQIRYANVGMIMANTINMTMMADTILFVFLLLKFIIGSTSLPQTLTTLKGYYK